RLRRRRRRSEGEQPSRRVRRSLRCVGRHRAQKSVADCVCGIERRAAWRRRLNGSRVMAVNVAVVGVTGAVGQEFLNVLAERNFPIRNLKLLASARIAGKKIDFRGQTYTVEELTHDSFKDIQIALFSAGGSISKEFSPSAVKAGAVVVD